MPGKNPHQRKLSFAETAESAPAENNFPSGNPPADPQAPETVVTASPTNPALVHVQGSEHHVPGTAGGQPPPALAKEPEEHGVRPEQGQGTGPTSRERTHRHGHQEGPQTELREAEGQAPPSRPGQTGAPGGQGYIAFAPPALTHEDPQGVVSSQPEQTSPILQLSQMFQQTSVSEQTFIVALSFFSIGAASMFTVLILVDIFLFAKDTK